MSKATGASPRVGIIGGGFTGLSAAFELARAGIHVTVFESDDVPGGLAGSFQVDGASIEKFYHHWFVSDRHVMDLIADLGATSEVRLRETRTGMYFSNRTFRLSSPMDVLRFTPLGWVDRIRLGLLVLQARRVSDWHALESMTAAEWIVKHAGSRVYDVVWAPLLRGKFGSLASEISAVWFWNKLVLRGGSRGNTGAETLAYFNGGFAALAGRLVAEIQSLGGNVRLGEPAMGLVTHDGVVRGVATADGISEFDAVLVTTALPIAASLLAGHAPAAYVADLGRIRYLANLCLVLQLDRSLSDTYWTNVNDPQFPYVGVIEHTNFEPPSSYGGRHLVYLSRYLSTDDPMYSWTDAELLADAVPHLQRMFPSFSQQRVGGIHVWRATYAQPIVVRRYGQLIPARKTPIAGVWLASMAQIYPEDRGTNYAIRDGRAIARQIRASLEDQAPAPTAGTEPSA